MGFEWTEEQRAVIDTRRRSILVSAAAGSGKTAVLVERLIRLLTDPVEPVKIEQLLVVTFTNAAAAEMRERIGRGLDQKLVEQPGNLEWQRQKLLLPYAQISTIHSLCLKIIRDHFDVLDLDPSFRIGDEAEVKLLKADVASDVMEGYYASGNKAFREFVDRYARGKTDLGIADMIVRIYDYAQGFSWPEYWLEQCCRQYDEAYWPGGRHPILGDGMRQLKRTLQKLYGLLDAGEALCREQEGSDAYRELLKADRVQLDALRACGDYEAAKTAVQMVKWKRLPRASAGTPESLKAAVRDIHGEIKEDIDWLASLFFARTEEEIRSELMYIRPSVVMLTELVKAFGEKYHEAKEERNMLDFSDLEHDALRLLAHFREDASGNMEAVPTSVADELSSFYQEVVCDEYQDSNQVQEMILSLLSGERFGRYNRFMVGDVKQSIYRFRMADAAIFMDKYDHFSEYGTDAPHVRIDLHQNFRSRAYVLESINYFFRRLMTRELGGIVYDEKAALYPGMVYPDGTGYRVGTRTELMLLLPDEAMPDEEAVSLSPVAIEAQAVAVKIRQLTDPETGMDIYDGELGAYRKAGYKDVVILLRTVSGWASTFVEVLGYHNIPVSAELSEGFFDTLEIRTMTALLSVVDNPGQDIPLAAVLRSPVAGLSSEELAMIRSHHREGSLYAACQQCGDDTAGSGKLRAFLALLEEIRRAAGYMELHELIQYIYDRTGYYDYVQAMPGGQRRSANLELLLERAVTYTASSYSGLFNFVRYIEQLRKNDIDFGEAVMPEDAKGRVRLLSVHKSKGLEYPIVILAGLGKKMNMKDASGSLVLHAAYGIGLDAVNLKNRRKMTSAYKQFISRQIRLDTLAEELRILYVAMTRAREKLIMTGMPGSKQVDEQLNSWYRAGRWSEDGSLEWSVENAKSYLDWLMPCLMATDVMEEVMQQRGLAFTHLGDAADHLFRVRCVDIRELLGREVKKTMEKRYHEETLLERKPDMAEALGGTVSRALWADERWQYPGQALLSLKGKYTVSELKLAGSGEDEGEQLFRYPDQGDPETWTETGNADGAFSGFGEEMNGEALPDFMKDADGGLSEEARLPASGGAFRGTAYHRVLELLDFGSCPGAWDSDWTREQLSAMTDSRRLSAAQAALVDAKDIADMVFSELGQRMSRADKYQRLRREAQFVMGVPVSMVRPEMQSEEQVIVQGVIDAFFEENGQLILVDYKTDRVPKAEGEALLRQRYSRQLDYYQYALERMTRKKVAERWIYAFALKRAILV